MQPITQTLFIVAVSLVAACGSDPEPAPTASVQEASWSNGDFETDGIGTTPTGWSITTYQNAGISGTSTTPPSSFSALNLSSSAGTGKAETFIVGGTTLGQADPDLGAGESFRYPLFGARAVRVNYKDATDSGKNKNANSLQQTMTMGASDVDPTDGQVHVRFAIAPVLENPSHGYTQQPYYYVELANVTRGTTLYHDFNVAGQSGVPWNTTTSVVTGNATQWLNWQLVDIAPGPAAIATGDQVKLTVVGSGCSLGGHFGRIYLDGIGPTVPGLYAWATGAQTASANSDLTYTFFYSNGGTTSGIGAHLDFVTPPQTSFVSTSLGTSCTAPAVGTTGKVSCPLGTLGAGASGTFTITVKLDATATGSIVNGNYSIGAVNAASLLGAKVTTTIPGSATSFANVSVTQSANRTVVGWGQSIQYTFKVANAGPTAIATGGLTVTDTMPAQLTSITWACTRTKGSSTTTRCGTSSGSGNISVRPKIGSGGELTYTVSGTITSGSGLGSITHTVTAGAQTTTTDPDPTNNTAVLIVPIGTSRTLTLTKAGGASNGTLSSSPSGISCGSACSSTTGNFADGSSVVLTATPIGGASFTSWSGACAGSARTCTVAMSGNQSVTATFTAAPAVGAAAHIYPYVGSGQLAPTGSAFTTPLAALVTDASGNVLSGITVTFTGPGSGAGAGFTSVTTTNAAGIATATATANATPGSYAATASILNVATPASFSLTNVGPATQLVYRTGGNPSDPQLAPLGGAFASNLVAIARDAAGNPAPGATVTYTAPSSGASATLTATSVTSDGSGVVQVGATANGVAGSYTITATLAGATPVTFNVQNLSPGPAIVIAISGSNQSADPSTAFVSPLTVVVADVLGNALPNVTVTFAAPSSGATATLDHTQVTTDSLGQASVNATANASAGTYTVSATVSGVTPATFTLVNNGTQFLDVQSGSPQAATVGASFGAPLVAVLTDSNGAPVSGVTVTFTAPASGAKATLSASTVVTDSSGLASVTATAGAVAGAYTVDVSAPLAGNLASFALTNDSGPAATLTADSGGGQTATAGAAFAAPLVARVTDASGNPVAGVTVTFAAPSSGATASLDSATAITDSSGLARVTPTAGTVAGSYVVSASVSGVTGTADFALTNLAASTVVTIAVDSGSPQSTTVGAAFSPLVAKVTDGNGGGVAGVTVSFTAPSAGATASLAATATTDSTGLASVTPVAGTVAGSYTISATAGGVSGSAEFSLTNLAGAAASIAVASGNGQSATVMTGFVQPLVAHVTDAHGNDVPGVTVAFSAPGSSATATLSGAIATTGSDGTASVTATAGAIAGGYSVTASVTGLATPASFALTNTAGAASELVISSGDGQSVRVDTAFATPLVVKAIDAHGNAVSGVSVTFAPPATGPTAVLLPTSATTGASGLASTAATAGTASGAYSITAGAAGLAPVSFTLTNTAGSPAAIAIFGGDSQSATVHTAFAEPLAATVTDSFGNVVPGATVTFSAPGTGAAATVASAVTSASGIASSTATANATAGSYSITGSIAGGASVSYALTNTAGAPGMISFTSGGGQFATVGTAFAQPLTVRVVDTDGNPVPDTTVTLTGPASGAGLTAGSISLTTGASGSASTGVTANHTSGSYTVAASVTGVATQPTATLTNQPGAAVALAVVSGDDQHATVAAAYASPLVVVATDGFGNLVADASVTFSAPTSGATAALSPATGTTGASGRISTSAIAGARSGAFSVTASIPGASTSFSLTNDPGSPAAIAVSSGTGQSATVGTEFVQPLVAHVSDAHGNDVPGVTVAFATPTTGAGATLGGATAITGATGLAQQSAIAGQVAGSYAVTASVTGAPAPASFALSNTAGTVATLTATGGDSQSAVVLVAFAAPLAVHAADQYGNAVSGAAIAFSAPATGATASFASGGVATTNASGDAQITATAGTVTGEYTAQAVSASATASFGLTNLPGPAASLAITAGGEQSTTVGTAFAQAIAVRVVDADGNPVPGATVTLTGPPSGAGLATSPITVTTGASGTASASVTANHTAGGYRIAASVTGVATQPTVALTNQPATATSLAVLSGDAQRATVTAAYASPLVVVAKDGFGNLVPGATVTFSAPATGASASFAPAIASTGASGQASTTATAGAHSGAVIVTAAIPGASTTFSLTSDPGSPAAIAVSSGSGQSATVATAFAQPLFAHVSDAHGNDVPGATVSFAGPTTGARATLAAATAITGATGLAQVSATAGEVTGSYAVTASVTGASPASFALTNTPGAVAALTATGGDGQEAVVLVDFAIPLAVHAVDPFGNAVPGAHVSFSAPTSGASATFPGGVTTDEHGDAQIVATAGSATGSYLAQAVSGSAPPVGFALTNLPGAAAAIAVVDGTPQRATVAVAFAAPLRVVVRDAQGNAVPAATVAFSAPASSASAALGAPSTATGLDGIAQITASANTVAGDYDVLASLATGASCAFHLSNTAGIPASITAAGRATPQQMTVGQPYAEPLAVTVRDRYGNPVAGATVGYTVPGDGPSVTLSATTATTDATGGAAVDATASQLAGSFIVRAAVDGIADAAAFALGNIAGGPATLVIAEGDPQSAIVDTDFAPLVVQVLDAFDNPVPAAVVSFAASSGDATAVLASGSAPSDAGGLATMTARAGTTAGAYTITASLPGAASPVSFALTNTPGAAATITAAPSSTPQNAQVDHLFTRPLVAQVLDAFSNPVPGVTVTFAAPATPATGALTTTTATTSNDGRVSTTITAGTVAGTYAITATANEVATPASFALANLAGEAHTITASAGAGQSATVATDFAAPIVALVQDAHGNAVPDATVVFTAPTSGATASPAHVELTTGADGTARTALTCAHVAGAFAIIATTGGGAAPAEFALSALPGSPATATALASATPQVAEVEHAFAHPLALALADAYGNPVPGAHVAFAAPNAPGAQLSADTATSDASGIASVLAIADHTAGRYRVTASVDGTAEVAFELTNTAAAPSAVLILGGGAQRTFATTVFAAPVIARVIDAFGNSVAGVAIAFSAPTTGATATMANPTPVSDTSGEVSVVLAAGPVAGRFILSAQVAGATAPATTALEVIAIPTTITASAPAVMPVNDDTDVTITVSAAIGTPGGTVDVLASDGTRLASAALDHGSARVAVSGLTVGSHTVTVGYAAQGSYGPSVSATVTFELTGDTGSLSGGGCSATGARDRGSPVGLGLAGLVALAIRRRRRSAGVLGLAAVIAAGTTGATASADPSARAIDRYHAASPDSAWFVLDSATFTGERAVAVVLVSDYARDPLDVYDGNGDVRARIVRDALVGQLGGSVTLRDRVRLSAAAVMATWQDGPGGMYNGVRLPAPRFAFGDVTLAGDVRIVGAPGGALRIAVGLRLTTPTGQRTSYMSDATFAGEPRVVVAGSLGSVEYAGGASAFLRRETMFAGSSFGSELRYQAALGERLLDGKLLVGPELFGAASLDGHAAVGTPLELQLGGHYAVSDHLRIGVAAGLGVLNAVGEPHWRALASLHWTP